MDVNQKLKQLVEQEPRVSGFTCIVSVFEGEYDLTVNLADRLLYIATFATRAVAEQAESAIHKAMVEYRAKRNEWEILIKSVEVMVAYRAEAEAEMEAEMEKP